MDNDQTVSFILSSCDKYAFLWDGFFYYLNKNWESFNYEIIMTTSKRPDNNYSIKTIKAKENASWSTRLIKAIKCSKAKYVFFCLDDFYITKKVNKNFIDHAIEVIKNDKKIKCITLHDFPKQEVCGTINYDDYFIIKDNSYRFSVNAQFAIWNKKYLLKLLHRGETAWEFEKYGSQRHERYNQKMLYIKDYANPFFYYPYGGVLGLGKYRLEDQEVLDIMKELNITNDNPLSLPDNVNRIEPINKKQHFKRLYRKIYRKLSTTISFLPYY